MTNNLTGKSHVYNVDNIDTDRNFQARMGSNIYLASPAVVAAAAVAGEIIDPSKVN